MRNSLLHFALFSIFVGCGGPPLDDQPITPTNYKNSIQINKLEKIYYGAAYEGKDFRCLQNNGFESCSEQFITITSGASPKEMFLTKNDMSAVFRKGDPLEAEAFRANISKSNKSREMLVILAGKPREFLLLALADLSLQRGFKYLVELERVSAGGCWSNPRADTFGTFDQSGTLYSGTTTLSSDSYCYYGQSLEVLLLNDREQLAKGIFYTTSYDEDRRLFLEDLLYMDGSRLTADRKRLIREAYNKVVQKKDGYSTVYLVPHKAWKKVYDASGLSRDLRLKYGVTGTEPYTFKDEREWNIKWKADNIIKKNLVK